jgi:hypothetical protein
VVHVGRFAEGSLQEGGVVSMSILVSGRKRVRIEELRSGAESAKDDAAKNINEG